MLEPLLAKISAHIYENHLEVGILKIVVIVACMLMGIAIMAVIKMWFYPQAPKVKRQNVDPERADESSIAF